MNIYLLIEVEVANGVFEYDCAPVANRTARELQDYIYGFVADILGSDHANNGDYTFTEDMLVKLSEDEKVCLNADTYLTMIYGIGEAPEESLGSLEVPCSQHNLTAFAGATHV